MYSITLDYGNNVRITVTVAREDVPAMLQATDLSGAATLYINWSN